MHAPAVATAASTPHLPAAPPADGVRVVEAGDGLFRVRMDAVLHAGWAGRLMAALAERRVNVVRGRGARHPGHRWECELLLEPLDRSVDLAALDYLRLSRDGHIPADLAAASLRLDAFSLTRGDDALVVDVVAVDALGFLDRILRVFAVHDLFPRQLHVETRGRTVHDRFRLERSGGGVPPLQVCVAVGLRLRELAGGAAQ